MVLTLGEAHKIDKINRNLLGGAVAVGYIILGFKPPEVEIQPF